MARNNRNRQRRSNAISNVRMVDPDAGTDSLKVDRQVSALKTSESQMRVLIGDTRDFDITTADGFGTWDLFSLDDTDEFNTLVQQFRLFRISSIKFVVTDINPNAVCRNVFATWHDNYFESAPSFTRANITDQVDSKVIAPGTGEHVFYWRAHGVEENRFQATYAGGAPAASFGGLKWYVQGGTPANKFSIQVHAVVDFRGRL